MSYVKPELVTSPKGRVSGLVVLHDGGENSWSLARMKWDGKDAVGVRWNGGTDGTTHPSVGNPQSRGVPTWFILPEEIAEAAVSMFEK